MVVVALVGLLLSAEGLVAAKEVDAPARGSVNGPWALVDLAFAGVVPFGTTDLGLFGGDLALTGGVGFQVGEVRFSPTARFSISPRISFGTTSQVPFSVWRSPVELALAVPDLLNDRKVTGLRLTPVFGVTVPTRSDAFDGREPATTLSLAAQLERRFGPVELAYRLEGKADRCVDAPPRVTGQGVFAMISFACKSAWSLSHTLFAEWFVDSFSIALGLGWVTRWTITDLPAVCPTANSCLDRVVRATVNHTPSAQVRLTGAFSRYFGVALELHLNGPFIAANFGAWFRTDAIIQRNWIDR